ncbi:MAG: Bax inhibitor-1/YccA family protein [Bacteroidales bacterium]
MGNPVLSEQIFKKSAQADSAGVMTVGGTATKTLLLLLMVIAGAAYTWKIYYEAINPASIQGWLIGGAIAGFILAMIISFSPKTAPFLSPIYAAAEGLFLGGISAMFNNTFATTAPNIVINAVILTMLTAVVMFTIYRTGVIKVNGTFMKVMTIALITIVVFYLGSMLLSLFGVNVSVLHDSSPLSIGISVIIVAVAAFSLLLDYNFIEKAAAAGAPKYMEWYGAFGLVVTLVWLYLEILKLLAKTSNRN